MDIAALEGGDASASLSPKELTFGTAPSRARRVLRAGDTILSTVRTYLKAVANFPAAPDGLVASTGFAVLRPNGTLHPRFAYWAALSEPFIENVVAHSEGVSYPAINPSVLGSLHLPVPPVGAQAHIANFLDEQTARIDALIAEKDRLLGSLKDAIESYAFHLVTEGLEGKGLPSAREEGWLKRIPPHWSTPKLGYFAEVGNGATPRREVEKYWANGTVPWVTSTAINDRVIKDTAERITDIAVAETGLRTVRPGSAIVGLIGQGPTRGMTARLTLPAAVSQNVAYVTSRDTTRVGDDYLVVVLTGLYTALRYLSDGSGGAQGAMNCDTLRAFRVPIAPAREQKEIVGAFAAKKEAIEGLQEHVREHIERLREYRSSLISAAVSGQLHIN